MFGNQLAMLSLLLVGLSLSNLSNLSEAVPIPAELRLLLFTADDPNQIQTLFVDLGPEFQDYADLINVSVENCTPQRILFNNRYENLFGRAVRTYVDNLIRLQRQLCEDTFTDRFREHCIVYRSEWEGKQYFQEFLNFVDPWPTAMTPRNQMGYIKENIKSYMNWYIQQPGRGTDINIARRNLMDSCFFIFQHFYSLLASLETGRPFQPDLGFELNQDFVEVKIAEAVISV